jgi:acetyl-CoA acetyltransferase
MKTFGTTQRQLAAIAAKNHQHSAHNPLAQYQRPFTVEEVLAAQPITYPLTLPMCSPVSDGAAAAIVCSNVGLKHLGQVPARCARVRATVLQTGSRRAPDDYLHHATRLAGERAYAQAGLGPADVSVAEVHDATAMGEIIEVEALQLTPLGVCGPAAERGELSLGGRLPVNPSGGLESKGHPIGATGLAQVYELVMQLRGTAGARQVAGARVGIAQNGGGIIGVEEAVVAVTILSL